MQFTVHHSILHRAALYYSQCSTINCTLHCVLYSELYTTLYTYSAGPWLQQILSLAAANFPHDTISQNCSVDCSVPCIVLHRAVLGPLCTVHYSFHWRCTLYWQCTLYIAVQVQTQDLGKSKFLKHVVTLLFCLKWTHNGISAYGCHKLATVIETRFNLCSCSVVCPLRLLLMLVVWPAQNAGADPSRCNSTNRQNPPLQKNCCNFLTHDAI